MPNDLLEPITGLSIANLEKATTTENDVLNGKTFYAGDKKLKTGTMVNRGAWGTTVVAGGSVTIPAGYHNGIGVVTSRDSARNIKILVNSTGRIASGPWDLHYSNTFYGYHSFIVSVVARNINPLYETTLSASSGSVSSAYLQAIAMEDDVTYLHAKLFTVSNANVSSTTLTINGYNGSGWGYIIYGIT